MNHGECFSFKYHVVLIALCFTFTSTLHSLASLERIKPSGGFRRSGGYETISFTCLSMLCHTNLGPFKCDFLLNQSTILTQLGPPLSSDPPAGSGITWKTILGKKMKP